MRRMEMNDELKQEEEEVLDENFVEDEELVENAELQEKEEEKEKKGLFKKKKKLSKEEQLQEEVEELSKKLADTQNMYYKAYADTENLKKRLQSDADTLRKYRIQSFAQEVLPVMDNFEKAITFEGKDEEVKNYVEGIKMIYQQIKNALDHEGVVPIDCVNQPFDPNLHQALVSEKIEGVEPGIVVEEIQRGYMLKDRLLRASLVKVSE